MTLMEKQDLMTAHFTHRATFGAGWCLRCQFGLSSFALQRPAPPHPTRVSLNQGLLQSKSRDSLAGETQEQRRGQSRCRSGHLRLEDVQHAPLLSHEHCDSQHVWMGPSTTHRHVFHLHFQRSQHGEDSRFLPQTHRFGEPTGSGGDERCVGRRTGESCFSGCVHAAYRLNVSFVVWSVKACV